ncbi:UNVERIFIED_CONTAM: Pikachurin [Trichonephila clavipes]
MNYENGFLIWFVVVDQHTSNYSHKYIKQTFNDYPSLTQIELIKGLFSRITFRLNLYLGGSPNQTLVADRTQVQTNFHGCLRHLAINRHVYDFRIHPRGDALEGNDIGVLPLFRTAKEVKHKDSE